MTEILRHAQGERYVSALTNAHELHPELYHVQKLSIKSLVKLGEPAVKPLIAALQDVDNDVRWMAAKALRQIKNPQAVRSLIAALQDDDFLVSTAAAEALKKIGTPKALAALEEYERNNRR